MTQVVITSRFLGRVRLPGDSEVNYLVGKAMKEIGEDAEIIFAGFALKQTGKMARNIKSRETPGGVVVEVFAKDATTGYDYVGVTRFGHRVAYITPRADRSPATVAATKRALGTVAQGNAHLRYVYGGRLIYSKATKGFHPTSDWAQRAIPSVQASARATVRKLGKNLEARFK